MKVNVPVLTNCVASQKLNAKLLPSKPKNGIVANNLLCAAKNRLPMRLFAPPKLNRRLRTEIICEQAALGAGLPHAPKRNVTGLPVKLASVLSVTKIRVAPVPSRKSLH